MSVLIAYGSIEGQTKKIAEFVERIANASGRSTVLFDTGDKVGEISFGQVEKVILAGSVHERRHPKPFEVFVSGHHNQLKDRDVLLLSVSLNAAFDEFREEAQDYVDEMKLRTNLEPDRELLVAGAIRPESYDYYAAQVLRHVVMRGKEFDPSERRHEFTDWDLLAEHVTDFLEN